MNCTSPRKWPSSLEMDYTVLRRSLVLVHYYKALRTAEQRFTFYTTPPALWQRGFEAEVGKGCSNSWCWIAAAASGSPGCVISLQQRQLPVKPGSVTLPCVLSFSNMGQNEPCWCSRHTKKGKICFQIRLISILLLLLTYFFSLILHTLMNTKEKCLEQHSP